MDRLSVVTCLVVSLAACDARRDAERPPAGRVDAVAAATPKKVDLAAFCDVHAAAASAKPFAYPELAEGSPPPAPGTGWRWVNVWATWCAPCVAEMPMIERWLPKLSQGGKAIEMVYLSVDQDAATVAAFVEQNGRGRGPRVRDMDVLEPWFTSVGLDKTAAIPIHVFVDPAGKTRCVRMGSIEQHHYDSVRELLERPSP